MCVWKMKLSQSSFFECPLLCLSGQAVRVSTEGMAHSRGEGVAGSTPTPSPSGSGHLTATHMELTHTDRAGSII